MPASGAGRVRMPGAGSAPAGISGDAGGWGTWLARGRVHQLGDTRVSQAPRACGGRETGGTGPAVSGHTCSARSHTLNSGTPWATGPSKRAASRLAVPPAGALGWVRAGQGPGTARSQRLRHSRSPGVGVRAGGGSPTPPAVTLFLSGEQPGAKGAPPRRVSLLQMLGVGWWSGWDGGQWDR